MKKKIAAGILFGFMVAVLPGCGKNKATQAVNESVETEMEGTGESADTEGAEEGEEDALTAETESILKIGILIPSQKDDERWETDAYTMTKSLSEDGYEAVVYYAGYDAAFQEEQAMQLLTEDIAALIIAPVDPYGLTEVMEAADEKSIPVFSYDGLIMNTDVIKYYVSFDSRKIGQMIGNTIIEKKELEKARAENNSYTIEFLMGSPDDNVALFIYNGIMEVLGSYLEDGTLVCRSGRSSFDETAVMDWEQETAKENLDSILEEFYKEDSPDILCTAYDPFAAGALEVLEERQILPTEENWPFITGVGCEVQGVVNVAEGTQGFTVFLDNRALAEECVKLVDTYMQGESPEVNDYEQYDNGKKIIGTVTCAPQLIDADNYQIVIDNGFYSEQDILPLIHPTDTPIPEVTEIFEAAETSQETETIEGTEASEEMETSEETETSEGTEASEEMEASEEPQTDEETQTSEEAEISDKVDILERIFRSSSRT